MPWRLETCESSSSDVLTSIGRAQNMPAAPATIIGWPHFVKAVPQAFAGMPVGYGFSRPLFG
jgi:hypothetical protein